MLCNIFLKSNRQPGSPRPGWELAFAIGISSRRTVMWKTQ